MDACFRTIFFGAGFCGADCDAATAGADVTGNDTWFRVLDELPIVEPAGLLFSLEHPTATNMPITRTEISSARLLLLESELCVMFFTSAASAAVKMTSTTRSQAGAIDSAYFSGSANLGRCM